MAIEEEELAALQAVYGDDCSILESQPPHLHLRLIPRTADLTSQQFVEAIIDIRASSQYPEEPPRIDLVDSKGLDERRQNILLNSVRDRATQLTSCLMLVALCEEAVERLTLMNQPDGDCPLCFECIIRWWNWLQREDNTNHTSSSSNTHTVIHYESGKDDSIGNCPVCRKVFHTKDFEHVINLVESLSFQSIPDAIEPEDLEKLLYSDSENIRRQRIETTLKLQEENNGLIEPKRNVSVTQGQSVTPTTVATEEFEEQRGALLAAEVHSTASSERPSTSKQRNYGPRKARPQYPRKPVKQWIRKEER